LPPGFFKKEKKSVDRSGMKKKLDFGFAPRQNMPLNASIGMMSS